MSVFTFSDLAFMGAASGYTMTDADAAAYVARVEGTSGDNQALENDVRKAIDDFVIGCKADGIWNAIKASCILAGARTLAGALQPLVGAAPTNFNFVIGDYNRKTGLKSNGSTKNINSNRNNNADPVDNIHVSVYIATAPTLVSRSFVDAGAGETGATNLYTSNPASIYGSRLRSTFTNRTDVAGGTGFYGISRSSSGSYVNRLTGTTVTINAASQAPFNGNIIIFNISDPRLSFYSIGESLNLALLDARVTTLINAFAAAIP